MGLMAAGSRRDNEIATASLVAATGRDWWSSLAIVRAGFEEVDRAVPARLNPLYPDCGQVIRELADAGFRLAILSADTTARVKEFVKGNGLADCTSVAIGSDGRRGKPDPLLAIDTCRELGISMENTLMVGDTAGDMEMARQAGAAGAIGIDRRGEGIPGAHVNISTLAAIVAVRAQE
jgi:phosphoglycolate phosphatase